jgi:hypothetical protein
MNDILPNIPSDSLFSLRKNIFGKTNLRKFNISENNIIGVELDQVLWYHHLGLKNKKPHKNCKLVHL